MSYQVLARKWRPRSFTDMVGQPHVVRALVNALERDRLHHAYLFSGTRGVGKTTVARIFAKSLNCERGVGSSPCGECEACRAVDEGRFVDLIEVDAASRTKVEDTRELLDNVQYAPTSGRYKVYLVDEVHMLSGHSFNALLKTLEEPPPHVKFLLATTEPDKLPVTILSRCLQFHLKRLAVDEIRARLEHILGSESIAHEPAAVALVAQAADGSMRDALSLLDQAIAFGSGGVEESEVRAMLGTVARDQLYRLLDALAAGDGDALLRETRALVERGSAYETVLADLIGLLHAVALAQVLPGTADAERFDPERLDALAARLAPEDVQLYYQIALQGRGDLRLSPNPAEGFEMVMLRMLAFRPAEAPEPAVAAAGAAAPAPSPSPARTPAAEPVADSAPGAGAAAPGDWDRLIGELGLRGLAQELAANCQLLAMDETAVRLTLAPSHRQLLTENLRARLEEALRRRLGRPLRLAVEIGEQVGESPAERRRREQSERQREAERAIESDPVVQGLREAFDAEVQPGSVRPVEPG